MTKKGKRGRQNFTVLSISSATCSIELLPLPAIVPFHTSTTVENEILYYIINTYQYMPIH